MVSQRHNSLVTRGYARYILAVMVGINFLNYMDRWVASAVAPSIQTEFHINDAQVGLLGTAFLLVYAVAALPFGYWGDRGVRSTVIGVGVTIWSLATLVSGIAGNYVQLFLSRSAVGVGEASYYPAGTSLVSDYFPKEQRGRVMSIWSAGSAIGIAVGYAGGGIIADHLGWRTAFYFAAASNAFWLPTLLHRRFDLSLSAAGLLAGVVLVLGGLIGTLAGGWIADRRAKTSPAAHLEVGIAGFLIGAVFIVIALVAPLNIGPVPVFVPAFLITVIALYMHAGPFTAVSQDVVSPALRASAVTMLLFVSHVFGDSHSTFDVGWISDHIHSLQLALLITSPTLLVVAAIVGATGLKTVKPDSEKMEAAWAARTEKEPAPAL